MKIVQHMEAVFIAATVTFCCLAYSPNEVTDPGPASFRAMAQHSLPDRRA